MTSHMIYVIAANALLDAGILALVAGMVRFGTRPNGAEHVEARSESTPLRAAA